MADVVPVEVPEVVNGATREAFLLECIRLSDAGDARDALERALRLVTGRTDADLGYVEIYEDDEHATPAFCSAVQCSQAAARAISECISRGIISFALAEGRPVRTVSAVDDERFRDQGSVRQNQIGSAICVPIGRLVTVGAIYLQARRGDVFSSIDLEDAELVASMLDLVLSRVTRPGVVTLTEAVRAFQYRRIREALERHEGNISAAASELGVTRKFIYSVMRRA
jgi:transcriptional regulator with GAF, ATPase, and Fis domain